MWIVNGIRIEQASDGVESDEIGVTFLAEARRRILRWMELGISYTTRMEE